MQDFWHHDAQSIVFEFNVSPNMKQCMDENEAAQSVELDDMKRADPIICAPKTQRRGNGQKATGFQQLIGC